MLQNERSKIDHVIAEIERLQRIQAQWDPNEKSFGHGKEIVDEVSKYIREMCDGDFKLPRYRYKYSEATKWSGASVETFYNVKGDAEPHSHHQDLIDVYDEMGSPFGKAHEYADNGDGGRHYVSKGHVLKIEDKYIWLKLASMDMPLPLAKDAIEAHLRKQMDQWAKDEGEQVVGD